MTLLFVGGVHGTGKSTLCEALSGPLNAEHLTASELIKYTPDWNDPTAKAVADVRGNQDRLIVALNERRRSVNDILLDGHFCLLDKAGNIVDVPLETFKQIDPVANLLVEADPLLVHKRLLGRPGRPYDLALIALLAERERSRAETVSSSLNIPLMKWNAAHGFENAEQFFRTAMRPGSGV